MLLKQKVLTQVLNQANTGGVVCTVLLTIRGTPLAFAGDQNLTVTSAIANIVYRQFKSCGRESLDDQPVSFLLLDCDEGKVALMPTSNLVLCLYAKKHVGIGLLKAKAQGLAEYLEEPMTALEI